jgi:predicted dehydrogenase
MRNSLIEEKQGAVGKIIFRTAFNQFSPHDSAIHDSVKKYCDEQHVESAGKRNCIMSEKLEQGVSVLLVGGFGHAVCVFDEWLREAAPVRLIGAVQTLPDEPLDGFLAHPWAQKFEPAIYQDLAEALASEKTDLVVVSTRPDLNPDLIERCLRAGCHVIAEKPLAVDEAGLVRLHTAARETGKHILSMLCMSNFPTHIEARELVEQGVIGEPVLINTRKSYQWGTRADWFARRETYGGIWPWVGIHAFYMARFITGRKVTHVLAAQEQNRFHKDLPDCSDCLSGLFLLEENIQMTVSIDLLRPDGEKEWGDDWIRVVGSEGSIESNPGLGTIRLIRKGQPEEVRIAKAVPSSVCTAFLDVVKNNADFSGHTALGLQLTDASLTAARASVEGLCGLDVNPEHWA